MAAQAGIGERQGLPVRDLEHLQNQVDAADFLGHRVLDLQPGVDLQERHSAVLADQELAGASAGVAGFAQDCLRRLPKHGLLLAGQERRWRLLDQLLVPPLQRAVPGGDDHDVAVLIGQALGLDVPGPVEVALDEALAAPERCDSLAYGGLELRRDLVPGPRRRRMRP